MSKIPGTKLQWPDWHKQGMLVVLTFQDSTQEVKYYPGKSRDKRDLESYVTGVNSRAKLKAVAAKVYSDRRGLVTQTG